MKEYKEITPDGEGRNAKIGSIRLINIPRDSE